MHNKCPYLSTRLECFAGSFGTARCFQHDFHSNCGHRIAADSKSPLKIIEESIEVLEKGKGILENLIRIDF